MIAKIQWKKRKDAAKWPEGSAVLIRRPWSDMGGEERRVNKKKYNYDVRTWFRPDQIMIDCFGLGGEEYALLERPK